MTTREYLRGVSKLRREIDSIEEQIDRIRSIVMPHSPIVDDMPHGGHTIKDPLATYAAEAEPLWRQLEETKKQYERALMDVEIRLAQMDNEDERYILREHYCAGKELRVIAAQMFLSESRVYHIHLDALKHFPAPESWSRL